MHDHVTPYSAARADDRAEQSDVGVAEDPGGGAHVLHGGGYRSRIAAVLAQAGFSGIVDPRHVESWMRVEKPDLDRLTDEEFDFLAAESIALVINTNTEASERLAQSFGLMAVIE